MGAALLRCCLWSFVFLRSLMVCVLFLRRSVLPMSWGDVCCSICLTRAVTHDPSTGVRATTSLRGERAQQAAYSLPSHRFSLALSFPQLSPLLWRTNVLWRFPRFHEIDLFISVLCSIMGMCSLRVYAVGGWRRRKAGDWGRKPGRGRGIAAGLPPFPWVVSPRQR